MKSEPGVDHPDAGNDARLAVIGRDITVDCRVLSVEDGVLVLRPVLPDGVEPPVLKPGDAVAVSWDRVLDRRVVPTAVEAVQGNHEGYTVTRWRLRTTGPSEVGQRRSAVRARVELPVVMVVGDRTFAGRTEDLSEGGALICFDGAEEMPRPGDAVDVHVDLDSGELLTRGEIIRVITRGQEKLLSTSFPAVSEREQDRIRRRVFQALREERARVNH